MNSNSFTAILDIFCAPAGNDLAGAVIDLLFFSEQPAQKAYSLGGFGCRGSLRPTERFVVRLVLRSVVRLGTGWFSLEGKASVEGSASYYMEGGQ